MPFDHFQMDCTLKVLHDKQKKSVDFILTAIEKHYIVIFYSFMSVLNSIPSLLQTITLHEM